MIKFRLAIIKKDGSPLGKNFKTREEVDDFLLNEMEKDNIKFYRIKDRETGEIIETEKGKYGQKNVI